MPTRNMNAMLRVCNRE